MSKSSKAWIIAVSLVLSAVWLRVYLTSSQAYTDAVIAQGKGKTSEAIDGFQRAIRNYTPLFGPSDDAVAALRDLAAKEKKQGDRITALAAYRSLRGAIRAIRGMTRPYDETGKSVDEAIAELMADEQLSVGGPTVRGRNRQQLIADHRALLALDPAPTRGWSLAIIASFIGWVLGTVLTIRQGLDRQARIRRGPFVRNGLMTLVFFGVWIVSLMNA